MIELTWGDIKSPVFLNAVQGIMKEKLPMEIASNLFLLINKVNNELTHCNVIGEKISKDYKDDPAALNSELGKLFSKKFVIKITPFPRSALSKVMLTVTEYAAIEKIFEPLDQEAIGDTEVNYEAQGEIQRQPQTQI